jgi:magnesium chelatase family protein
MPFIIQSAICIGMQVVPVSIEAALGQGFSGLQLIGLPQDYARDARERIRASLESLGIALPARRLVVSVRPAETLKVFKGGLEHLDLPCAVAILAALADSPTEDKKSTGFLKKIALRLRQDAPIFAGQLTLSGRILPPDYILPFELMLLNQGTQAQEVWSAVHPSQINRAPKKRFIPVESLRECLHALIEHGTERRMPENQVHLESQPDFIPVAIEGDLSHTQSEAGVGPISQSNLTRLSKIASVFDKFAATPTVAVVLALAAAGRHHILLAGSPGCGKTFALRHLAELLPPLPHRENLEVALIHQRDPAPTDCRPFRHPHHSASAAALLGGSLLQPGEVSLAHHGLLFLDELAEFPRPALEALREPLDERKITLSRARGRIDLPADFLLASATNPCACGFFFSRTQSCRCVGNSPLKYQQKLSGPLLERFSLLLLMDEILDDDLRTASGHPSSPLAELAASWQKSFAPDPVGWVRHFLSVQHELWNTHKGCQTIPSPDPLSGILDDYAKNQKISSRGLFHLRKLLVTLTRLFPEQTDSWKNEKTLASLLQLRGLESALRQGASFLAPSLPHQNLKESGKWNDT